MVGGIRSHCTWDETDGIGLRLCTIRLAVGTKSPRSMAIVPSHQATIPILLSMVCFPENCCLSSRIGQQLHTPNLAVPCFNRSSAACRVGTDILWPYSHSRIGNRCAASVVVAVLHHKNTLTRNIGTYSHGPYNRSHIGNRSPQWRLQRTGRPLLPRICKARSWVPPNLVMVNTHFSAVRGCGDGSRHIIRGDQQEPVSESMIVAMELTKVISH